MDKPKKKIVLQSSSDITYHLTANKKQSFYLQDLSPMKKKIMGIFFMNPQLAANLMNRYNQLVDEIDETGQISIRDMSELLDLENQIEETQQKLDKGNIEAFYYQCEKLLSELTPENINTTEEAWKKMRGLLQDKIGILTLQERSQIENALSGLRFYIIREKVKQNGQQVDLLQEIPEEESAELETAFYFQLSQLLSSSNRKIKQIAEDIKNQGILYQGASGTNSIIYDKKVWEQLAQIPILPQDKQEMSQVPNSNEDKVSENLALVPIKQNFFQRIWEKFKNIKRTKSEIEKITEEVVTEEMLEEYQDLSMPPSQRYIPDKRLPVYDFLKKMMELQDDLEYKGKKMKDSFCFKDETGVSYICEIKTEKHDIPITGDVYVQLTLDGGKTSIQKEDSYYNFFENPLVIKRMADFLHLGGEFEQFLGNYYKNASLHIDNYISPEEGIEKKPYYKKLAKRLERAMKEYKETQFEFYAQEEKKQIGAKQKRQSFLQSIQLGPKSLFPSNKDINIPQEHNVTEQERDDK